MRKRCSFRLDMVVHTAAGAPAPAANASSLTGAAAPHPKFGVAGAVGTTKNLGVGLTGAPPGDVVMNGTLASANCALALRVDAATTHIQAYFAKAVNYTLMITALSFVQVLLRSAPGLWVLLWCCAHHISCNGRAVSVVQCTVKEAPWFPTLW